MNSKIFTFIIKVKKKKMKSKFKVLLTLVMALSVFTSLQLKANDEELVCYYQENEKGELEYVCVDPYEVNPCKIGCPPPCDIPEN